MDGMCKCTVLGAAEMHTLDTLAHTSCGRSFTVHARVGRTVYSVMKGVVEIVMEEETVVCVLTHA